MMTLKFNDDAEIHEFHAKIELNQYQRVCAITSSKMQAERRGTPIV
jgi:hypothetical protein